MNSRRLGKGINLVAALLVTGGILYAGFSGVGPLPPMGPAFNPGTGVWTVANGATLPTSRTLTIQGLKDPVRIQFDQRGTAYIDAANDHDLFFAIGYLHAKYRLFQMDLMRRQGEGLLSQVVGVQALPSDEFEDSLGLSRTAKAEWQALAQTSAARQALLAYTSGVNAVIKKDIASGNLPFMFKLLGYQPTLWQPTDTLVIQGIMTQDMDFTTAPLDYALYEHSLGVQRTMQWFPILPPDSQSPYDTGPYHKQAPSTLRWSPDQQVSLKEIKAVDALTKKISQLPPKAVHHGANSNNWAVDGTKTTTGKALMAGDPHLNQTIPSIWYQISAKDPHYDFQGVSIPGLPIILIGRNQNISWSLTDVQDQATFFYQEKTSPHHKGMYKWNGKWVPFKKITYTIPVKGEAPVHDVISLTVHGPVMTTDGETTSVDWVGAIPSPDLSVLLAITKAKNYTDFRNALKSWFAPALNFVYADQKGNIGLLSAGYYPIIKSGQPWLPLPGTGASDIVGSIPFQDIPQAYDPPTHMVFSANQRVVGKNYPYYIGTTYDFFDNGYRADLIHQTLSTKKKLSVADMETLQNSVQDYLATLLVPKLVSALKGQTLTAQEKSAVHLLATWHDTMTVSSQAASIWWEFLNNYLIDTFQPWWNADHVPVNQDSSLQINANVVSLQEDLEAWTLHDPTNPAFTLPNGTKRTANSVMREAFTNALSFLSKQLGPSPQNWQWGNLHARAFPSLAQVPSLGFGPKAASGDPWTINAADGGMVSSAGPSWRFIMNWANGQGMGVYPGGQSENPLSPWYEDQINAWWNGHYFPMQSVGQAVSKKELATWSLQP